MTHCEYPVLSRIFLQWLFVERLVTLSNAEAFFIEMIQSIDFGTDENNEKDFSVFIDFCKKALNPINIGLKKQIFVQSDMKLEYLGLCNIHSDDIAQVATKLNPENIDNFKKLIDAFKDATDHGLSLLDMEHIIKGSKNYVLLLISELIENDWIYFSQSQCLYFVGPRTLLELSDYLKELAEESNVSDESAVFQECVLCSSIICSGKKVRCRSSDCKALYHKFCLNDYCSTIGKYNCVKCQRSID